VSAKNRVVLGRCNVLAVRCVIFCPKAVTLEGGAFVNSHRFAFCLGFWLEQIHEATLLSGNLALELD